MGVTLNSKYYCLFQSLILIQNNNKFFLILVIMKQDWKKNFFDYIFYNIFTILNFSFYT